MATRKPLVLGTRSVQELPVTDSIGGDAALGVLTVSTSFVYGASDGFNKYLSINSSTGNDCAFEWLHNGNTQFRLGLTPDSDANLMMWYYDNGGNFISNTCYWDRNNGNFILINSPAVGDSTGMAATAIHVLNTAKLPGTINTTGGTTTLTPAQYAPPTLIVTGALTSNAVLVMPNAGNSTVINRTTGGFSLTVKTASGSGPSVAQGYGNYLVADGVNVIVGDTDMTGVITPITSGGTGSNTAASARVALGLSTNGTQLQWTGGTVLTNGTYYFALYADFPGTITALDWITAAGSFTANVQINGVSVTGLSAVAVSGTTKSSTNATAANTFAAGATITVIITSAASSPTGCVLHLRLTR